jgi:hypothetical protein
MAICVMLFLCTIYWYFFQGIQEPIVFKKRLIVGLIRGHSAYIILTVMMILGFIFLKFGSRLTIKKDSNV